MVEQSSSRVSYLLSQINGEFEGREANLAKAQSKLQCQVEALEEEKRIMQTVPVAASDILNLNIGGTLITTKRSTLMQAEGSGLAARFNGNWEHCLDRDDQGRIFFDWDPYCFQQILCYLRWRAILSNLNAAPAPPKVEASKQQAYMDLVRYLLLEDYMGYSGSALHFASASSGIQLDEGLRTAKLASCTDACSLVIGPAISGIGYMKFKVHAAGTLNWMYVGIGQNVDAADSCNYSAVTSHGWSNNQYCWNKRLHVPAPSAKWSNGDWVMLKADMGTSRLSIISSQNASDIHTNVEFDVGLRSKYVFHLALNGTGIEVELLPVTLQDQDLLP